MSHSVNSASIAALEQGVVTSASVMVTCPWFGEVAQFATNRTDIDLGLHITLTSEWHGYKWGPILGAREVSSLTDGNGYFHSSVEAFANSMRAIDMRREVRAQIETALHAGLHPTHLDSHMCAVAWNSQIYGVFSEVAAEFSLPHPHIVVKYDCETERCPPEHKPLSHTWPPIFQVLPPAEPCDWELLYSRFLRSLESGLNQITVHLGFDNLELQSITKGRQDWNAAWRQRDFDVLSSQSFKELAASLGIGFTSWKEALKNGFAESPQDPSVSRLSLSGFH